MTPTIAAPSPQSSASRRWQYPRKKISAVLFSTPAIGNRDAINYSQPIFYRLANLLHIRTRDRTIRQQLLFAPGEPWREQRGEETARALRTLDYLEPRRLEARREDPLGTVP